MQTLIRWVICGALVATLSACGGSSSSGGAGSSSSSGESSVAASSSEQSESSESAPASSSSEGTSSSDSSSVPASSSGSSSSVPEVFTGVFIDSAVIGIGYRTVPGGHEGVTNSEGEFLFSEGDRVTFFIGDLEFPEVRAMGIVTPANMLPEGVVTEESAVILVNITRLLQSLDNDGDPSNGIVIPPGAAGVATAIDLAQTEEDFEQDPAVINLIANSGSVTTELISSGQAMDHFGDSMEELWLSLTGTWYYQDVSDPDPERQYHIALSLMFGGLSATEDGEMVAQALFALITDEDEQDSTGMDGYESGMLAINLRTGELFGYELLGDTNGEWGLSHPCSEDEKRFLDFRGDSLHFIVENAPGGVGEGCDEGAGGSDRVVFQRVVASEQSPLVGSWMVPRFSEDLEGVVLMTFTEDGYYLLLDVNTAGDDDGQPGIERGTYTYDPESGEASFVTQTDTNGQWGLSHPCAILGADGVNQVNCGEDGADITQKLIVEGGRLTYINEADTIAEGEESPFILCQLGPGFFNTLFECLSLEP